MEDGSWHSQPRSKVWRQQDWRAEKEVGDKVGDAGPRTGCVLEKVTLTGLRLGGDVRKAVGVLLQEQ